MADDCNILPRGFDALNCDDEMLTDAAIEGIARIMCRLNCSGNNIRCLFSSWPPTWEKWFTDDGNCDEAPCGSIVIVRDNFTTGGPVKAVMIKTAMKEHPSDDAGTWASLFDPITADAEFRVADNLADPQNPTVKELNALFGGLPANRALVFVPGPGDFWFTQTRGRGFTRIQRALNIQAENFFPTVPGRYYIRRAEVVPGPLDTVFSVKTATQFGAGARIRCIFGFGYKILSFGHGTGPVDSVEIRAILRSNSGGIKQVHVYDRLRNGYEGFGVHVDTLQYPGRVQLDIRSTQSGSYYGWKWEIYLRYVHFVAMGG